MAGKKATSPDVKSFASMMIKDHTKSTADLKAAIAKSGQSLTPIPAALPADMQVQSRRPRPRPAEPTSTRPTSPIRSMRHTTALGVMQGYAMGGDTAGFEGLRRRNTSKVVQMPPRHGATNFRPR